MLKAEPLEGLGILRPAFSSVPSSQLYGEEAGAFTNEARGLAHWPDLYFPLPLEAPSIALPFMNMLPV